ncbi:MAG: hypothetical protein H6556_13750 [Lewinellaceae bacterium]|nr:hypothetical protein [Lewinellaceae bacterium]
MPLYQLALTAHLSIHPDDFLSTLPNLEVRIPCINCQRFNRTIFFKETGQAVYIN